MSVGNILGFKILSKKSVISKIGVQEIEGQLWVREILLSDERNEE